MRKRKHKKSKVPRGKQHFTKLSSRKGGDGSPNYTSTFGNPEV